MRWSTWNVDVSIDFVGNYLMVIGLDSLERLSYSGEVFGPRKAAFTGECPQHT